MRWGRALAGVALAGLAVAAVATGRPVPEGPAVSPWPLALPDPTDAVALARVSDGTLVLTGVNEAAVAGVRVAGDPLSAWADHGWAGLAALRDTGTPERRPLADLQAPAATATEHVGSGNNFADHQQEVGVHDLPELFPKLAAPTPWDADLPAATRLDPEVELCAVALDPIRPDTEPAFGFVLCNDATDRWAMVAGLRPGAPLGTTGFPDGKGGPGRLPTGPWLVIPRDADAFTASVTLRLTVNGRVRQEAPQAQAIWDHRRIATEALARCGWDWRFDGGPAPWPACGQIPTGTLLLGGTPAGVVFRLTNLWAGWRYLQPGDVVVAEGTGLGRLENRVVAP